MDAWQLTTWEDYRDVARLGRKTRVGEKQRETLWAIFQLARDELQTQSLSKNTMETSLVCSVVGTEFAFTGRCGRWQSRD